MISLIAIKFSMVSSVFTNFLSCVQFQKLSTYYLQEAEPSFGDQITLTAMSSVIPLLCVSGTVGMGYVTMETFEWVASRTTAIVASAKIGRFMNDIAAMKVQMT